MKFTKTIHGDKWEIRVNKRMPKGYNDASGVTFPHDRIIVFKESDLSLATIIHELGHAYHTYLPLETTHLEPEQTEEIYCEFLSKFSVKILKDSIDILMTILDKKELPIHDDDRALIGDLYELHTVLNIIAERLDFDGHS